MIGYGPHPDYDWEATMRNMKFKMEQVFSSFRIKNWSEIFLTRKFQWACKIINMDTRRWAQIISLSTYFEETGYRKRERPKIRWEDYLNNFAHAYGYNHWINFAFQDYQLWEKLSEHFVAFVLQL